MYRKSKLQYAPEHTFQVWIIQILILQVEDILIKRHFRRSNTPALAIY